MPNPKDVFDNPLQYLDFLQSADFERQLFDRKEVRINNNNQINTLKEKIKECISAFANSNREGGLLVLGIADDGAIKGTQHVNELKMNNILQARLSLTNHSTITQDVDLEDSVGNRLHFLYTPWIENAICETVGNFPKGWRRDGPQNFPLTDQDRERLKRDKRIVDFETRYCCSYDPDELDLDVVEEFKDAFLADRGAQDDYTTEGALYQAGALIRENDGYAFTNAGFLFFAKNPCRRFASAFVRVLRFEVNVEESQERGVTTFDKDFDGALPNIIRKLRTFFKDSALFRTITRRSSHRGFIVEPEYPLLVVDEALVNAAIHRDYGATTPIRCIAYQNGLVVGNPGSIPQAVPQHFDLANTVLDSVLRNPKIVEWMRIMKDERGEPLVRALSEGTRKMLQEMEKMGLPAPSYETTFMNTSVTLYNRLEERLELHAYAHTKDTTHSTPSTSSGQGNMGKMSGFIEGKTVEHVSKTDTGLSDLPNGWEWTRLQEVCSTPQYGWTTKATTDGKLHLLRTTDITAGNVNWEKVPFCLEEPLDKEKYLLKTGDIVISRAGSVGYSYLVKNPQNAVFASYLIRFKPSSIIDENYLIFFLKSPDYWKTISKEKAGIALPNVNATKLKRIEVPIPPLAEQSRIVSKIDNLFTQLDAAVDNLKKAQVQLQRYRRSLLKSAFEGELTREWREGHTNKFQPMNNSTGFPQNWEKTTVGKVIKKVSLRGKKVKKGDYELEGKLPVIDQGSSFIGGYTNDEELKVKCELPVIVFGDHTKAIKYVDFDFVGGADGIKVIKSQEMYHPKLFYYFIRAISLPDRGYSRPFQFLEKAQIPVPPLTEQAQIVSELERHLSVADEIEATIAAELKRSERLRQSILKHAFSGKLVPQDPNDESASVLLEKIREEKERQQPKRRKQTTKSKTQDSDNYPLLTLAEALEHNVSEHHDD